MNQKTGIEKALALFGGSPTALAKAVGYGVLRQHIEHWVNAGRVPADRCPEVYAATKVPLDQLNKETRWHLIRGVLAGRKSTKAKRGISNE